MQYVLQFPSAFARDMQYLAADTVCAVSSSARFRSRQATLHLGHTSRSKVFDAVKVEAAVDYRELKCCL